MMYNNPLDAYTETAVYTVTAVQHQALYDLLLETANRWQRSLPGLLSVNIYPSEDHTHILYQVEWRTREDWHKTLQHPEREAIH
ncbi:hypothetical protein KSD_55070 [Ktedonobacter sp. SOSP1-85]|uniref:antibiotic biosynthesis monooxygenase n=1 Tax=Ktedonobacter sp. SOSP1-85 TaxID=2778367 RepID=UPI0019152880|nr:antibiotic biosynthesis monooxygenase [Ktedonobacter sp. SOSP1-85]GHO77736.1 hypothetical protein KSD_55070 [Ktedonobacter sp. SOSP1-85]